MKVVRFEKVSYDLIPGALKRWRESVGVSRRQVALAAGISPAYYGDIENGMQKTVPKPTFDKIAAALKAAEDTHD